VFVIENNTDLNLLINNLQGYIQNQNLNTVKKRADQAIVFIASSQHETAEYKDLMSELTSLSMRISAELNDKNISYSNFISNKYELTEKQKETLIEFSDDFSYLKPMGGPIQLPFGLEYNQDTLEAIKLWADLIIASATILGIPLTARTIILNNKLKKRKITKEELKIELLKEKVKEEKKKNN